MPIFEYTASDRTGSITHGELEAANKAEASSKLASDGMFVLEIKKGKAKSAPAPPPPVAPTPTTPDETSDLPLRTMRRPAKKKPPKKTKPGRPIRWNGTERALYLRQLEVMFCAGIPIHRAAAVLTESEDYHPRVLAQLEEIPRNLERGIMLSKCLERSRLFNRLVVSSVRLGEETGRLEDILEALADSEEQAEKLKRTLISRLTYPVIVLVIMSIGLVILGHVMSRVMSSLPNFDPNQVPLFGFFNAVFRHGAFLPGVIVGFTLLGLSLWHIARTPDLRVIAEQYIFAVPVLGGLLRRIEANTVTRQISLLLSAGLPIDRGLKLCSELVWTESFKRALLSAREQIREGAELAESFYSSGLFPDDVTALVTAGEVSGNLDTSLQKAAAYCADQVERTLEMALALIEPLLIGFLGIAIGTVLLCTFVPVFNSLQTL